VAATDNNDVEPVRILHGESAQPGRLERLKGGEFYASSLKQNRFLERLPILKRRRQGKLPEPFDSST
jgi:hypothetical protein